MRDDTARLRDMWRAVENIQSKTSAGRDAFERDEMIQVWVLHHLQIIGEAARSLSDAFRMRHPDRVWADATGLRHILVHHYFDIQPDRIWAVVVEDLPKLREILAHVLREEVSEA